MSSPLALAASSSCLTSALETLVLSAVGSALVAGTFSSPLGKGNASDIDLALVM